MSKQTFYPTRTEQQEEAEEQGHESWHAWCRAIQETRKHEPCGAPVQDGTHWRPCLARKQRKRVYCNKHQDPDWLTDRQERFCLEYLKDRIGAAAYRRAGYNPDSPRNASVGASKLLARPNIGARIAELEAERTARTKAEGDDVIRELAKVGFTNLADLVDWSGGNVRFKDPEQLHPDVLAAVKKIKMTEVETDNGTSRYLEIELHDKVRPLAELARIRGLHLPDSGDVNITVVDFEDVRDRLIDKLARIASRRDAASGHNGAGRGSRSNGGAG